MNIKAYIDSGILELYALDQLNAAERAEVNYYLDLYVELKEEILRIEIAMETYAFKHQVAPPAYLGKRVLGMIKNLQQEKEINLSNLPLINKFTDYKNWLKLIDSFGELPLGDDGRHIRVLRHDENVTQMLIVSTTAFEQEVHQLEQESFLILSGECKCTVGNEVRLMKAGDYMSIPLFEPHDVQLLTPKVCAILQRVSVSSQL